MFINAGQSQLAGRAERWNAGRVVAVGWLICVQPCVLWLEHALATDRALRSVREGFVYVPYLLSQGVPSLSLADTCAVCGQRWRAHGSRPEKRMRCPVLAIKDGSAMSQQWRFY